MDKDTLVVGKGFSRIEAQEKAMGIGKYTADIKLPGMLYGKMVRSKYAHAKILSIDTSKAKKLPGVKAVLTIDDVPRVLHAAEAPPYADIMVKDQYIFDEKVRFVGEGVAAVAAISNDIAEEALELVVVEYEELPAVFDPLEAMKPDSPRIHSGDNNICGEPIKIQFGDIEKGFEEADYIFEDTYKTSRVVPSFIEPHVCTCSFDQAGRLTIWASTQSPFMLRSLLAEVLNMPMNKIRVIKPNIGGAFGGKHDKHQHEFICALLARKTDRPVKMEYSRKEVFYAGRTRHPIIIKLKQGIRKDGAITAREGEVFAATGAYASLGQGATAICSLMLSSLYRCPNVKIEGYCIYTNTTIAGAHRGYGNPQATFALESQMDTIAEKLGIDPMELRLKNHVRTGDIGPMGLPITSCGLADCIEKGAERIKWKEKRGKAGKVSGKKKRGIGMACLIHASGGFPVMKEQSSAMIKVNEDGTVSLFIGTADLGTGSNTSLAQIAAEELGVCFDNIHVIAGDTDVTPFDSGSGASRTTYIGGNAVKKAAAAVKRQMLERASNMLEAAVEDLEAREGKVFVKGSPEKQISIQEVSKAGISSLPAQTFMSTASFEAQQAPPFGAQFAEVEVDTETGQVQVLNVVAAHDVGRAINPQICQGQIEGGIETGIGYALTEEFVLDGKTGEPINPNFTDYRLIRALDMPNIDTILVESMDPTGPFGAKGIGEPVMVPTAPAIANAIYNAIGVRIKDLPMTPERILEALKEREK